MDFRDVAPGYCNVIPDFDLCSSDVAVEIVAGCFDHANHHLSIQQSVPILTSYLFPVFTINCSEKSEGEVYHFDPEYGQKLAFISCEALISSIVCLYERQILVENGPMLEVMDYNELSQVMRLMNPGMPFWEGRSAFI